MNNLDENISANENNIIEESGIITRSIFFASDGLTPIWLEPGAVMPQFDRLMRGEITAWAWLKTGEALLKWTMGCANKRTVRKHCREALRNMRYMLKVDGKKWRKRDVVRAINSSAIPEEYIYYLHNYFALEWYQTAIIFDADTVQKMGLGLCEPYVIPGIRVRNKKE